MDEYERGPNLLVWMHWRLRFLWIFAQIHFGSPWPLSFIALLRAKVSDPRLHRKIALEGHRFTPQEALQGGFLDHTVQGNTAAVFAKAEEVAEAVSALAMGGVWGIIKVCCTRQWPCCKR